jgi:hypothetical protein
MTPAEYIQLKAFARQDGVLLSVLWVGSFGCYVIGLSSPFYAMLALLLTLSTPFVAALRLRNFRDYGCEGFISLMRGWAFVSLMFFYAGVLFALAQYAYFAFIDNGFLVETVTAMMSDKESKAILREAGMWDSVNDTLHELQQMRPIDLAVNVLTTNITAGIVLGLPIAVLMRKNRPLNPLS